MPCKKIHLGDQAPKFNPLSLVFSASVVGPKGSHATVHIIRLTRAGFPRNLNFSKNIWRPISPEPDVMNFGLDIFPEAMAEVYMTWKYDVDRTRIGDDINEKRKFDLAYRRNAWYDNRCTIGQVWRLQLETGMHRPNKFTWRLNSTGKRFLVTSS